MYGRVVSRIFPHPSPLTIFVQPNFSSALFSHILCSTSTFRVRQLLQFTSICFQSGGHLFHGYARICRSFAYPQPRELSEGFDIRKFLALSQLDTMVAEQNNSVLVERVKKQAAFMTQHHFMIYLVFLIRAVNARKNVNLQDLAFGNSAVALIWQENQKNFEKAIKQLVNCV